MQVVMSPAAEADQSRARSSRRCLLGDVVFIAGYRTQVGRPLQGAENSFHARTAQKDYYSGWTRTTRGVLRVPVLSKVRKTNIFATPLNAKCQCQRQIGDQNDEHRTDSGAVPVRMLQCSEQVSFRGAEGEFKV